jgi:hypothetical protein
MNPKNATKSKASGTNSIAANQTESSPPKIFRPSSIANGETAAQKQTSEYAITLLPNLGSRELEWCSTPDPTEDSALFN